MKFIKSLSSKFKISSRIFNQDKRSKSVCNELLSKNIRRQWKNNIKLESNQRAQAI